MPSSYFYLVLDGSYLLVNSDRKNILFLCIGKGSISDKHGFRHVDLLCSLRQCVILVWVQTATNPMLIGSVHADKKRKHKAT